MITEKNKKVLFQTPEKTTALVVFITLLFALFVLWIIEMVIKDLQINFRGLLVIHRINPSLWLADILPFILSFLKFWNTRKYKLEMTALHTIIDEEHARIEKYTDYANNIGKGIYNINIEPENNNDQLGQSLQLLQNFLKANQKKENDQTWIPKVKI
jgi:hypothetical protein